jgi:ribosomal protein L20A (L18A)
MQTQKPDFKHITIEDIRKIKKYENLSDLHAQRLLYQIQQYVSLLVSFHEKQQIQ